MVENTTALEVASIGLLGVLIGSAISTVATYVLAVRRERVEAAKEHETG